MKIILRFGLIIKMRAAENTEIQKKYLISVYDF
jgi:hypothetical protein